MKKVFSVIMALSILFLITENILAESDAVINPQIINSPPAGKIYHGVFPGSLSNLGEEDDITLNDLLSYESAAGKTAAWVYFSDNWYVDRDFPLETATWIRNAGSIPYIRLMLWDKPAQNKKNRKFTLRKILNGRFDDDFRAWARSARDFGSPLIVEYGVEVNGRWFPWNGKWNGRGKKKKYGDPTYPNGPERFRDAYRHIIDIMREEGATNITWVFHVDNTDTPAKKWNRFENYYPGGDYIDWVGVSIYGAQTPLVKDWPEFRPMMDDVYPRLVSLANGKPIALLEFGVTDGNPLGDQAVWAENALTDLIQSRWPNIIGFTWWNEFWENDNNPNHDTNMRVEDNPDLANVFHDLVGGSNNVLGRVVE